MTRKLYWENAYDKEFTSKITEIRKDGIILEQTLFYPVSGNQVSDKGILIIKDNDYNVINVIKDNNDEIIHQISTEFLNEVNLGDIVTGKIDWKHRYGVMKAHSSQHILSAIVKNKYNIDTERAEIGFEEVKLKFAQPVTYDQSQLVLKEFMDICTFKNQKIESKLCSPEEIENLNATVRGAVPDQGQVRIVEIKKLDLICCGGTHVRNSTEIGIVFIYEFKNGQDIKFVVGERATNKLIEINVDLLDLSELLSVPVETIKQRIQSQVKLISEFRQKSKDLAINLLHLISQCPNFKLEDTAVGIVEADIDYKIISKTFKTFPTNFVLIVRNEEKRIRVLSSSENFKANAVLNKILEEYGGKGGGNPKSSQGTLDKSPENFSDEIISLLKERFG